MQTLSPVEKRRGRGRKLPNVTLTLPTCIFEKLRAVGLQDKAISDATGVPRPTITRACAGASWGISMSADELERLKAFAAERLAGIEAAATALSASKPQLELFAP